VLGQLGQLAATYPFVLVLARLGWARSFGLAAVVSLSAVLLVQVGAKFHGRLPDPAGPTVTPSIRATLSSPATRLGVAITFTAQFSGQMFVLFWGYPFLVSEEGVGPSAAGLMLGSYVVFSMVSGLVVAAVLARTRSRPLRLAVALIAAQVIAWAAVLAWPDRSPGALLWLLMLSLSFSGPAAVIGLDLARETSQRRSSGLANGLVNTAGFVSTVLAILFVGLVMGTFPLGDVGRQSGQFRLAMCTQFVLWAAGIGGILIARRKLLNRTGLLGGS
jgi:predicted MFS family arabinose efflux permease